MSDDSTAAPTAPRGYRRLPLATRGAIADVAGLATVVAAGIALFMPPNLAGAWLRLPALCALIAASAACWFAFRRMQGSSAVLRGGLFVALIGVSLIACAMHRASGFASLAGGLGLLAAFAFRGSTERLQVRGRDVRQGPRKPLMALSDQVESLASALVIVLLVWHFALEAFRIPTGSMAPTLSGHNVTGDRVFVDKLVYEWRDPRRWEPTVFRYPLKRDDPYVKRLIGLPGEELLIAQGDIYIRRNEGSPIELLTKTEPGREVLWLPLLPELNRNTAWIENFLRQGPVDFEDGEISFGAGSAAIYPKGTGSLPGNIVDHDASFGTTETPPERFGLNVCGDVRVRMRLKVDTGSELTVSILRDGEVFKLRLRPGAGACTLAHQDETGTENLLSVPELGELDLETGRWHDVSFSLADGEIHAAIAGRKLTVSVGTPLLTALRERDERKSLQLSGLEAVKIASAEPAGGRRARVELRAGAAAGGLVDSLSIDRDIYYTGRRRPDRPLTHPEYPLGVKLGTEDYFVLGDNSPGSKDSRFWIRGILRMKDGTQLSGGLDDPHQELAYLLGAASEGPGQVSALQLLQLVAQFDASERPGEPADGVLVQQAVALLREHASRQGRGAIDFHTEGGGFSRVLLSEIETIQVQFAPQVERKLFVGRPFAVFLSPRGPKLID